MVDRKLVEAPPCNFIAGHPKAALLFWFFMAVLYLFVCGLLALYSCIAGHFALCHAL